MTQQTIIQELGVKPEISPSKELEQREQFLAAYLAHTGLRGFVLGISGGQDSLLAGLIAKRAIEIRRNSGHNTDLYGVMLPYGAQSDKTDAELACTIIAPDYLHDINIKDATDGAIRAFDTAGEQISDFHKGNIKARMRMIAQYALAGQHHLLVVGTDHAAEAVTGFFTKFGDGGADVTPLTGLNKRQGREVLRYLNVPDIFLSKQPTADLLDERPGRPDEDELALTYDQIDDYLEGKILDKAISERIEAMYARSWHKRNMPVAFSKPV